MIDSSILDLEVYTVPCDLELVCPQWHTFGLDYLIPLGCVVAVDGVRFVRGTARYRTWCDTTLDLTSVIRINT
jgi:hypothetical protein